VRGRARFEGCKIVIDIRIETSLFELSLPLYKEHWRNLVQASFVSRPIFTPPSKYMCAYAGVGTLAVESGTSA
jgi:hypothetical protein